MLVPPCQHWHTKHFAFQSALRGVDRLTTSVVMGGRMRHPPLPPEMKGLREAQRPQSPTPLEIWCERTGTPLLEVARGIRASYKSVWGWAKGQALPGLIYAFRLERLTKGGVPAVSWLGTELGRYQWEHTGTDFDAWDAAIKRSKEKHG